jgi:hypothetical protein
VRVVNSSIVPNDHVFRISFVAEPDSVRATGYTLTDTTTGQVLFARGRDLTGAGNGTVGAGLQPVVSVPAAVAIDSARTGFRAGGPTNAALRVAYNLSLPIGVKRPGFPDDLSIEFADAVVDTSVFVAPDTATAAKFRVVVHTASGDQQFPFRFRDRDGDGTLSRADEFIDFVTYHHSEPERPRPTWRFQLAATTTDGGPLRPPRAGDVFDLELRRPLSPADVFTFRTTGESVDPQRAAAEPRTPYVVPNPYVGSASFEPERFAVAGRGERRIEFRDIPLNATIRIFNVRGELVQRLQHDGSTAGMVPWNLRTKDNLDVAPGLYVFHVDGGETGASIGKFAILK